MPEPRRGTARTFLHAIWPRTWWGRALVVGVPFVLVLAAVSPFVSAAHGLLALLAELLGPLVSTPAGRLVLLNGILAVTVLVAVTVLRDRIAALRSGLRLRAHLDGIAAFVEGEADRARDRLRRVAASRAAPPPDLPELGAQARLFLARIALGHGDPDGAMRELARVREADLPDELRRAFVRLSFAAIDAQGDALPEQLERDLRAANAAAPDDVVLLARLRDLLRGRGAVDEAADLQRRIVERCAPRDRARERSRYARLLVAAGERALEARPDGIDVALRLAADAHRADPDAGCPHLLRGDALSARGDLTGALREYLRTADLEGLARAAALLDAHAGRLGPREVLEAFPLDGGLLLVARELARSGEAAAAARAARLALQRFGDEPELGDVLRRALRWGAEEAPLLAAEPAPAPPALVAPPPEDG